MEIGNLLKTARAEKCSDVHITQGLPITVRKNGALHRLEGSLSEKESKELILSMCSERQKKSLDEGRDQDFAYSDADGKRYRVNVYRQMKGLSAAVRVISDSIPTLEELSLPPVLKKLADEPSGLVLLTGPTGSGKSTTLAAMIDHISKSRAEHILTVEDPIEYTFDQNLSIIHQREVGASVQSFAAALRSAMREDPDVILVGEMRDYETISTAVTAAETGHLVLSTLHTTGASHTIDRIIDTCPPQIQNQMRSQLSMVIRGIITQQLLPTADKNGRIAATEILIGTDAVGNLIREDKCHQLPSVMQSSAALGMHTLNGDLARLVKEGRISGETALQASTDKADLRYYL
ncbi:MAG: type IV pilus twitching motility protein PilT [Eubacteriaceae bacterium]|nr:type IV pilus twitching motility protein PilT [Eubacteriaceae bacterium]